MGNGNGLLDIETINNELMEQRNINTKPAGSGVLNTENMMNSGTMNPVMPDSVAMEPMNPVMPDPVAMEPINPVMPDPVAMEPVNPLMPEPAATEAVNPIMPNPVAMEAANPIMPNPVAMEAVNPAMPTAATMEAVNPAMPTAAAMEEVNPAVPNPVAAEPVNPAVSDFSDLGIQDHSQNFNQATTPETMDSRSFTQTEADWKRVPEGTDNYVDFVDPSDNYYSESKPLNFFQGFFAFLVSFILAVVFLLIVVKIYNIEYISKLQCLEGMLPALGLFYGFYCMTGQRKMPIVVGILLIVLNEFISYFMFHAVMAHGMKELYAEFTYKEAWKFVNVIRKIPETKELYYTHFASIFGVGSLSGIVFGYGGMKGTLTRGGLLDKGVRGGRRY